MKNIDPTLSMTFSLLAKRLWRFLCSVRLALVLILAIAAVSLPGALIIQAPDGVADNTLAYARWLEELRPRFGTFTAVLEFLGLFRVFKVWWFNVLLSLLVLNLAACTINRFPAMWRTIRHQRVKVGQSFFERRNHRAWFPTISLPQQEIAGVAVRALRQQRYRVVTQSDAEGTHIYAERNRYTRFGTFLTHGGIILAIAAAVLGNLAGFSDKNLVIPNGSVRAVGHGTGLSVLNEGFIEEDYPDGRPMDYRSDLVIYENGVEVKRQTVRVNKPVEYRGIRFHQSFFGNAAVIRVRDTDDEKVLFEDGVALAYRNKQYGEDRPVGFFKLFDGRLMVDVVGTAQDAFDDFIQPWEIVVAVYRDDNSVLFIEKLTQGEPFETGGLEFTFLREKQFTGLTVVKNPGVNFLWLATALIVLGIYTVLYFPHRRIWVLCSQSSLESPLAVSGVAPRLSGFDLEFQRLVSALEREMGTKSSGEAPTQSSLENNGQRSL